MPRTKAIMIDGEVSIVRCSKHNLARSLRYDARVTARKNKRRSK